MCNNWAHSVLCAQDKTLHCGTVYSVGRRGNLGGERPCDVVFHVGASVAKKLGDLRWVDGDPMPFSPLSLACLPLLINIPIPGLGFCHGENYFCRDSGKKPVKTVAKTSKNRQKLAKSKTP